MNLAEELLEAFIDMVDKLPVLNKPKVALVPYIFIVLSPKVKSLVISVVPNATSPASLKLTAVAAPKVLFVNDHLSVPVPKGLNPAIHCLV